MEIILLVALGGLAVWWFFIRKDSKPASSSASAPYKVESPPTTIDTFQPVEKPAEAPAWHTAPPEGTKPLPMPNPLDVNNDGKVNLDDVKEVVKKAKTRVKKVADVDGDGRVTKADAKAAAGKAKTKVVAKVVAKKKVKTSKK